MALRFRDGFNFGLGFVWAVLLMTLIVKLAGYLTEQTTAFFGWP